MPFSLKAGYKAHLENKHVALPMAIRKSLIEYAAGLSLKSPEKVRIPERISAPIPGLELTDSWQCDECGYVCASELNMIQHCKSEHEWIKAKGQKWEAQKVQIFFLSKKRRYFVVIQPHKQPGRRLIIDGSIDTMWNKANQQDLEEDEQLDIVDVNQYMIDKSL